jgi:hypothetical protein
MKEFLVNPQERIKHRLIYLKFQLKTSNVKEEDLLLRDQIDKCEQRLKDINNMGKRQRSHVNIKK